MANGFIKELVLSSARKASSKQSRNSFVSGRSKCTTPGRNEGLQSVPPGGRPKGCTVTGKNRSMCGNYGQHTLGATTTSNLKFSGAGLVDSTHCPRAEN